MKKLQAIAYTAKVRATGGREGSAKSDDENLNIMLSTPKSLGGDGGKGSNPEQLFAAGYAACFIGALKLVAGKAQIKLPDDIYIDAQVSIGPIDVGFNIAVKLAISAAGVDKNILQDLVEKAHEVCPYSNATRGNVEVELLII